MMVFANESVVLCLVFTLMVYIMSRKPIENLAREIQEKRYAEKNGKADS